MFRQTPVAEIQANPLTVTCHWKKMSQGKSKTSICNYTWIFVIFM